MKKIEILVNKLTYKFNFLVHKIVRKLMVVKILCALLGTIIQVLGINRCQNWLWFAVLQTRLERISIRHIGH